MGSDSDKKLFRETTADAGDPPAHHEPWPARKLMVATVLAACCCAAVAMGSAGVTSQVRGLKDPTDVGAVDAEIFDDDTPGRRLRVRCRDIETQDECMVYSDFCKWKSDKNKCKR